MKLEKYTEVRGALRSPKFKEEMIESIYDIPESRTRSIISGDPAYGFEKDNSDVLLHQTMRVVSLLAKVADLSSLTQEQQDAIGSYVYRLESGVLIGDQTIAVYGGTRFSDIVEKQTDYSEVYADQTDSELIQTPYHGLEQMTVDYTHLAKYERETLIVQLLSQAGIERSDLTEEDDAKLKEYELNGTMVQLESTYEDMPAGRGVYVALDWDESVLRASNDVINEHIKQETKFDKKINKFVPGE